jgi:transcription antitermination factor NusA-like protein
MKDDSIRKEIVNILSKMPILGIIIMIDLIEIQERIEIEDKTTPILIETDNKKMIIEREGQNKDLTMMSKDVILM